MKPTLILVLAALAVALNWTLFVSSESPRGGSTADSTIARATAMPTRQGAVDVEERASTMVAPKTAPGSALVKSDAPGALDGTVVDRFGNAIAGERVFLVAKNQGHPPANAKLTDYVTATTSASGRFSLTLPDAGPWRLAVGPPGRPRLSISEPHSVSAGTTADIVVPGAAMLRVAFDALPEGDEPIRLEVLLLQEPRAPGAEGRGRNGGRQRGEGNDPSRRRERRNETNEATGAGDDTSTRQRGGQRQSALDARSVPPGADGIRVLASPLQQEQQAQNEERREAKREKKQRAKERQSGTKRARKDKSSNGVVPDGLPPERWRAHRRHALSSAERAAGVVEFAGFPVGPVFRLALFQGDLSLDGAARFALQEDAVLEVRVLPISARSSSSLSYTTTLRFLESGERPAGVHWRD